MRRTISLLLVSSLALTLFAPSVYATNTDDLLLYMGIKPEYVWHDTLPPDIDEINIEAGNVSPGSTAHIFTTKDTPELIAQALSNNHPSVSAGFERQIPMRDLMQLLTGIKSASDILKERGRDDLLALAYLGGYVAPERDLLAVENEDGEISAYIPLPGDIETLPQSESLGQIATYLVAAFSQRFYD